MNLDQRWLAGVTLCDIPFRPAGLERGARIGNVKSREPTCALVSGCADALSARDTLLAALGLPYLEM